MEVKQAVEAVTQGINLAVGNGAFKNTRDVAILNQALEVLVPFVMSKLEDTTDDILPPTGESEVVKDNH